MTGDVPRDFDEQLAATRARAPEFVGLSEDDARRLGEHYGLLLRVVAPGAIVTADLRPHRVTLVVQDGVVTRADAG